MAATKITSRVLADDAVIRATLGDDAIGTAEIADDAITSALVADDIALGGNPTTTTQSASNSTTRIATTAFVQAAVDADINALIDSAPGTMNTLDEIAAALNDDPSFTTTVNNAIALKAPIANPVFTGNATFDSPTLYVDSSNNRVGIGDTTPSYTLDVAGTLRATGVATFDAVPVLPANTIDSAHYVDGSIDNAHLADDAVGVAELSATGTASSSTFLRGDNAWSALTPASITSYTNSTNNRIITSVDSSTVNAEANLTWDGSIFQVTPSSGENFVISRDGSGPYIGTSSNHALRLITNNAERIRILADGKVGIGDASPSAKLVVSTGGSTASQGDTDLLVRHNSAGGTTAQVQILAGNTGYSNLYLSDTDAYNIGGFIYNHSSNYLATNVAGAERMRIDTQGYVGIGVIPETSAASDNSGIFVGGLGGLWGKTTAAAAKHTTLSNNVYDHPSTGQAAIVTDEGAKITLTNGTILLATTAAATTADAAHSWNTGVNILANGKVGIGVADPDCMLEIGGTDAMSVPAGTTAQAPGTPRDGMVRYDETTEKFTGYVDGAWHTFTTASVQPDVQFQLPSTSHIRGTISAAGKIFTMSGSGYSGVSTNLNFEGNFIIITSWQHDYMGMGIAYKDDITNADFTGESSDGNGFYGGNATVDGFTSSTSFHGVYHAPSGQGGNTNSTKHYFMHKRTGNVVRMDYSTNASAATDPDHASWTQLLANQTISSSNHVKPLWGEAGGGAGNDPLRMLYTDVTGATNSD